MSIRDQNSQEMKDLDRHIAEAERRIDDIKWRIASIEQAGGDPSDSKVLLRQFEEALRDLIAARDTLLREKDQ